jgi:ribose/xylose/arabinose/galactoside ABC-type transport system permease subunit
MREKWKRILKTIQGKYIMELVLLALCVVLASIAPRFLTAGNFFNVLRNISMKGIIAFGMTIVIIAGEIDLSVGSAVALAGCLTAFLTEWLADGVGFPVLIAIIISIIMSLIVGFLVGSVIALMRTRFAVPTFITSLAFMAVLSGVAMLITGGFPLTPFPEWYGFLGNGYLFGFFPFPAVIFLLVFLIMFVLMGYTAFGRSVYAVGGNMEAARLSGIKVGRVKMIGLGLTSMLAAMGGVMVSAQIMSGTPTTGRGWELEVISAVIIGGTSFSGGEGKIWGTFIGVIFLGVIFNGLTLLGVSEYWQYVVRGTLILAGVLINTFQKSKA